MTDQKSLIERLVETPHDAFGPAAVCRYVTERSEAATTLAAITAERDRLREALIAVRDSEYVWTDDLMNKVLAALNPEQRDDGVSEPSNILTAGMRG